MGIPTEQKNQKLTIEEIRAIARASLPTFHIYGGRTFGGYSHYDEHGNRVMTPSVHNTIFGQDFPEPS